MSTPQTPPRFSGYGTSPVIIHPGRVVPVSDPTGDGNGQQGCRAGQRQPHPYEEPSTFSLGKHPAVVLLLLTVIFKTLWKGFFMQGRGVVSASPGFEHVRASHQGTCWEQASPACPSALQTRPPPALAGTFTAQECCCYCCALPQPSSPRKTPCGECHPVPSQPASRTDGRVPMDPPEVGLGGWRQLSNTSACRPPPACCSRFEESRRKWKNLKNGVFVLEQAAGSRRPRVPQHSALTPSTGETAQGTATQWQGVRGLLTPCELHFVLW